MDQASSIDYRRDYRTVEQFAKDIKCHTKKEKFLLGLFSIQLNKRGICHQITNNGIDNTGELVKYSNCAPDYRIAFYLDVGYVTGLYEIKNSPVTTKWTFKTHHLKQYIEQDANILLFWGTGRIYKDNNELDIKNTRYGIISPLCISTMLNTYTPYKEYSFGNRICIQIPEQDFNKWCQPEELL